MIAITAMGILVETIPVWRLRYLAKIDRDNLDREGKKVSLILTAFHGLQAFLGYILMLAAMTYSIEIFASTVIGLALGHHLSYKKRQILKRARSSGGEIPDNGTPCCEFLQDDEDSDESVPSGYSQFQSDCDGERTDSETAPLHQRRPNASLSLEND